MRIFKKMIALLITFTMLVSMFTTVNAANSTIPRYTAADAIKVNSIDGISDDFIMGADVSMLEDIEKNGGVFFNDAGTQEECLQILADHGVNWIRIRIWNDPTTDAAGKVGGDTITGAIAGTPAGAGTCDEAHTIALALRAKALGMKVLLDFHYSDFWTDPGKQTKPKAWKNLTGVALQDAVYTFTKDVITHMKDAGAMPDMVQVGNENNNGMLWADGHTTEINGFANWIGLINAATKAIREVETLAGQDTKIMLHLANGGDNTMYRRIFDKFTDVSKEPNYVAANDAYSSSLVDYYGVTSANGAKTTAVDFDIIGLSYYAFWHGPFKGFKANLDDMAARYNKEIAIAEVGYGFTFENGDSQSNAFGVGSDVLGGYQATIQGQAQYIRDIMEAVSQLKDSTGTKKLGLGIFYWEPEWIPVLDDEGNTKVGWIAGGGDDSENRAMFDFDGYALPSLDVFKDVKKTGTTYTATVESLRSQSMSTVVAEELILPETVLANYSDGAIRDTAVTWEAVNSAELQKLHTFTVQGSVNGSDEKAEVIVNVIGLKNYVTNPGFEKGNLSDWTITKDKVIKSISADSSPGNNSYSGEYNLKYDVDSGATTGYSVEQTITGLPNGTYTLKVVTQGEDKGASTYLYAKNYGGDDKLVAFTNTKWHEWKKPEIQDIRVTKGECTIGVRMENLGTGAWGNLDNFEFYPDLSAATVTLPASITSGTNFTAKLSYSKLIYNVYAQDITINYDTSKLDFVKAEGANSSTTILSSQNSTPGTVRILAANTLVDGISWNEDTMNLIFTAKAGAVIAPEHITITKADLGTADGSVINPCFLLTMVADMELTNAEAPSITEQATSKTVNVGGEASLSVAATASGTLSYQWYSNTTSSTSGAAIIANATAAVLSVPTGEVGTKYYYCVVTNTDNSMTGTKTATTTSSIASVTVNALPIPDTSTPASPAPTASTVEVKVGTNGKVIVVQKPVINSSGTASVAITADSMKKALDKVVANAKGVKEVTLEITKVEGAKAYAQELPKETVASEKLDKQITIVSPIATLSVPSNMLNSIKLEVIENVSFNIGIADISTLDEKTKSQIGNRPVIDLSLSAGGKTVSWSNPNAPVTVSIPYTPTAEELKDSEHIIVYYIDGTGKLTPVTNSKYDKVTGKVVFTTTHFSKYAVAFVNKTFKDVNENKWYAKPVGVLASKGILAGSTESTFSPNAKITRGEFIEWLVKTMGLSRAFDTNFSDVSKTDTYYDALGIAKAIGITSGTGNNKYSPKNEISRQDMLVMTVKALSVAEKSITAGSSNDISKFADASKVAKYAVGNVATMVKSGLLSGDGKNLNPTQKMTRAEAAQVLYKILVKYM